MNNTRPVDKQKKATEEQIFYNIMQLVQSFPQYSITQHFAHILRKKGDREDHYYWSNDKFLKKIEDYRDELERELSLYGLSKED